VTVVGGNPVNLVVNITATLDTSTGLSEAEAEANITAELEDMLFEFAETEGTIYISQIREAISRAAGEKFHTLTAPVADVTYTDVDIPILGGLNVVWS